MIFTARFGAAQTGLGYQFYDAAGTLLAARVTSGIVSLAETGAYHVSVTPHADAVGIYWNSTVSGAQATEDLRDALAIAALDTGGGSGDGAYTITVSVTDGTDPLQGATVRVREGVDSFVAVTDADGEAVFALDAATYSVAVTKAGYQFTPTTRTVTGEGTGTLTSELAMTARTLPAEPEDPTLCTVFVDTVDMLGEAVDGLELSFRLYKSPQTSASGAMVTADDQTAETDGDGHASVELVQGVKYQVRCHRLFGSKGKTFIPSGATHDLAD